MKDVTTGRSIFSKRAGCKGCRYRNIMANLVPFVSGLGKFPLRKGKFLFGGSSMSILNKDCSGQPSLVLTPQSNGKHLYKGKTNKPVITILTSPNQVGRYFMKGPLSLLLATSTLP